MTSFYDSDELITDDELSRNGLTSPATNADFTPSPGDSALGSNDNTPTAFQRNGTIRQSPRGKITEWNPQQCANFVSELGRDYEQYGAAIIGESIQLGVGSALEEDCMRYTETDSLFQMNL
jgi:hypothetical protein